MSQVNLVGCCYASYRLSSITDRSTLLNKAGPESKIWRMLTIDDWNHALDRANVGVQISLGHNSEVAVGPDYVAEAELLADTGSERVVVVAEQLSKRLSPGRLGAVPRVVLMEKATPAKTKRVQGGGGMYVDLHGNCFFSFPSMHVDVRGRGPTKKSSAAVGKKGRRASAASLFTPRRAQVSAMLLSYPGVLELPSRDLAVLSGTSAGTVTGTLQLLAEGGYLYRGDGRYRFAQEKLGTFIDAWADAYPSGLGAHLELFRGDAKLPLPDWSNAQVWLSGEQAVPDLIFGGTSLDAYVEDEKDARDIIRELRLQRSPRGNVRIRRAFWDTRAALVFEEGSVTAETRDRKNAPLALVYADVRAHGDPRLLEVSEHVKSVIRGRIQNAQH